MLWTKESNVSQKKRKVKFNIKSVNINSFGGIKNKKINFSKGLNIVYGENEAGKSTIQSFIKIWLYGFSSYKGKDYKLNERIKYTPNDGDNISG